MQNKKPNNNSNLPLLIIGAVLLAAVGGGWWWYSTSQSKPATTKSNTNSANKKANDSAAELALYNGAPAGAQPANSLGAPTATVTVEEFADFQCPTCATVHTKMKEINSIYGGRIKFIYRNFPLTQIHANAYDAATAAEAAGLQGKFWAMQDQLFTNQSAWSNSNEARKLFAEYGGKIGLDVNKFQTDMMSLQAKKRVDDDIARGNALNVRGTPTVFINGYRLDYKQLEVGTMRQLIDAELAKGNQPPAATQTTAPQTAPTNAANQTAANTTNSTANNANK